jgi:FMN phosphatase YigB (HAD superfamily)
MDRNYCTPDGKNAALFLDVDGTILECKPLFEEAARSFAHFMAQIGFDGVEAHKTFRAHNHRFSEEFGFELNVYGDAMVETYRQLVATKRRRFSEERRKIDEHIVRSIAMSPYFRDPNVFPECGEVLRRAHHNFMLFAVSIGNREAQKYKVHRADLPGFEDLIFTSRDNKAELVSQVMHDLNISPQYSAFVGNSKRSDGACLAVTNFIYLPIEPGWAFDDGYELPQSKFEVFEAKTWREAEEMGIKRVLRRRRSATPAGNPATHSGGCCQDK